MYEEGDILKRKTLGFTLQLIANSSDPVDLFYKGGMAQTIGAEITDNGRDHSQPGSIVLFQAVTLMSLILGNTKPW